jgi:hypothetical protein
MSIFVSYSHKQSEWVHQRLIPVLRAAGGDVLVDTDFKAGQTVIGQMDKLQSGAGHHVLVITAEYVASPYCRHEMEQAIKSDPGFAHGKVLPISQDGTPLPPELSGAGGLGSEPIHVDLCDDKKDDGWALLLKSCSLTLRGAAAPNWLRALDQTRTHLERNESVNLVVKNGNVDWRLWIDQLKETRFQQIAIVDLEDPRSVPREGLIAQILRATGRSNLAVPAPHNDLPVLAKAFEKAPRCWLALKHFDSVKHRGQYGHDLFSSLRWLVMDEKKLVLLAQSRAPIATLLPPQHDLSLIDFKTVELG